MSKLSISGCSISDEEIEAWKTKIDNMTHFQMAHYWRTGPCFPVFHRDIPIFEHFDKKFRELGGFTPEINKQLESAFQEEKV